MALTQTNWGSLKLGAMGELVRDADDIQQAIAIIIRTPKGSVPHRPDFGADIRPWLDMPMSIATPRIIVAVVDAIDAYEPRVEVLEVKVVEADEVGTVAIEATVRIKESSQVMTVEVPLGR